MVQWKAFENLVARIEERLAPLGAVVRSPDHLPDKVTGEMREVDGSIRSKVGSTPILITIECRKRGRKQDVRFIEEFVTKRDNIGAQQTILVTEAGLSKAALRHAKHHNIEVRVLRDITTHIIDNWVKKNDIKLELVTQGFFPRRIHITCQKEYPEQGVIQLSDDVIALYKSQHCNAKIFVTDKNVGWSIYGLIEDARKCFPKIPGRTFFGNKTNKIVNRVLECKWPVGRMTIKAKSGASVPVLMVIIEMGIFPEQVLDSQWNVYEYKNSEELILSFAETTVDLGQVDKKLASKTHRFIISQAEIDKMFKKD